MKEGNDWRESEVATNLGDCATYVPDTLRLDADYPPQGQDVASRQVHLFETKDLKDRWFHVRAGAEFMGWFVGMKADDVLHLVDKPIFGHLQEHLICGRLATVLTTQDEFGLWWLPRNKSGGKISSWNQTALEISQKEQGKCISVRAEHGPNAYRARSVSPTGLTVPQWPDITLQQAIARAFGDRIITSTEHPVAKATIFQGNDSGRKSWRRK